ncbi:N-acetyltransferase [uncultured Cohaesibacter sp.]|uniref:GNAT family N-acetyltransferase n=1 Tax=uncultured Cohaesibacter sp. TaxID=1002546 RepID=UPI00293038FB|nr:N-acetyltransferase [uncultured Cohaesibacter sp.]
MEIRKETAADFDAIMNVTLAAAKRPQIGKQTGYATLNELRKSGLLTLSLVADVDGTIVGHAGFYPITISGGSKGWYALGPISVLPECGSQGIRKALIAEGIEMIRAMHGKGVAIFGDPDYFRPLGFKDAPDLLVTNTTSPDFMVLPFGDKLPQGRVQLPEGFQIAG